MKRAIIIAAIMVMIANLFAQNNIDAILMEIEKNNTTLLAYRKNVDAQKIGNKTKLTLQNPEIEFNYFWGNPSAIGNRTDFSIKQSFDFPTAYSYKSQISDLKNEQTELDYQKQRKEIFFRTRSICVKLIYYNALITELNNRNANAMKVADAYKAKFNSGDIGILDFNKAQVNLLNATNELQNNKIEQNNFLAELTLLNGGKPIEFTESHFSLPSIPVDFEQWFTLTEANNPLLQWVKQEIIIASKDVKLQKAMALPKFNAGYMSEKIVGEQFQGISVGMSIPLWENKNTVKFGKAKAIALQNVETDTKMLFYSSMKSTHSKVIALLNNVSEYRTKLALFSNSELLEKAFNLGEISLTEYMFERSVYYESVSKLLEMEMYLNLAMAELNRYE